MVYANGFPHSCHNNCVNRPFVVEFYFRFRRMDVDVDMSWVNFNEQRIEGMTALWERTVKCRNNGMVQIATFDIAIVNKEELLPSRLFCKFRFTNVASNTQ